MIEGIGLLCYRCLVGGGNIATSSKGVTMAGGMLLCREHALEREALERRLTNVETSLNMPVEAANDEGSGNA